MLGKWSRAFQLGGIPVHFAIAPTDSGDDLSSQVVWWNGGPGGAQFAGGLMFWHPPTGGMDSFANDTLTGFPSASFFSRHMPGPARNIFCAAHARLPDGRLFVAGGTDSGSFEVGIQQNTIFDPHTRTWDVSAEPLTMTQRRWYATATTLPDGKVLIHSGSKYFHIHLFGGSRSDSLEPNLITRLGLAQDGQWDGRVSDTTGIQPQPRELHTAVAMPVFGHTEYFGGHDPFTTDSTVRNKSDLWFAYRDKNTNGPDYAYSWRQQFPDKDPLTQKPPAARYLHGAARTSADELVLFGGARDMSSGAYDVGSDLWVLRSPGGGANNYKWYLATQDTSSLSAAGIHIGPRCGMAMWRDTRCDSIIMFGGARSPDAAPTDEHVYALKITWNGTGYVARWDTLAVTSSSVPGARANAATCADGTLRQFSSDPNDVQSRGFLFGGRDSQNALRNDLWQLWVVRSGGSTHAEWNQVAPQTGAALPGPRINAAVALEPEFDRLVLVGGDTTLARARSSALWAIGAGGLYPGSGNTPAWSRFAVSDPGPVGAVSGLTADFCTDVFMSRVAEIYDSSKSGTAAFTALSNDPHLNEWYPYMFVVPDANTTHRLVFEAGPRTDAWLLDADAADGQKWQPVDPPTPQNPLIKGGSAVLYRVGAVTKVMKCGTRDTEVGTASKDTTLSIDLTSSPTTNRTSLHWQVEPPMKYGRVNHNLVLLPTGDVIVFGGTRVAGNNDEDDTDFPFVFTPELWHPRGDASHPGAWDTLLADPFRYKRGYHSGALLLPDGRVLAGGGNTLQDRPNAEAAQVFTPPYLFAANGTVLPRPRVLGAQGRATYGDVVTFVTDTTVDSVVLIRAAATTHAINMDQRRIPLTRCTACRTDSDAIGYHEFTFQIPADSAVAPPGDYMAFAVKAGYAPAIARWIRVSSRRPTVDPGDLVHPARIGWFRSGNDCDGYTMTWNAPADDSTHAVTGPVVSYDARWNNTLGFCDTCWTAFRSANSFAAVPQPVAPGSQQTMSLSELSPGYTYQIQIVAADDRRTANPSTSPLASVVTFHYNYCDNGLYAGGGSGGSGASLRQAGGTSLEGSSFAQAAAGSAGESSTLDGMATGETRRELVPIDAPQALSDGLRVRLRHAGATSLDLTGLRLIAVDSDDSSAVLALPARDAAGQLQSATRVVRQNGADVTSELQGDSSPYHGFAGDTLIVSLSMPPGLAPGIPLPLRVRAAGMPPAADSTAGFLVQIPANGGWRTAARFVPHDRPADFAVDSVGASFVRLVLLSSLDVASVDRLVPGAANCSAQSPSLAALTHSRFGTLSTSVLSGSDSGVSMASSDTLLADFASLPATSATRHWYLELAGMRPTGAGASVAANREDRSEPVRFALEPAHPNPFSGTTTFRFAVPAEARVAVELFDVQGRRVATLARQRFAAGWHVLTWDRRTDGGALAPAGIYLCRMTAGSFRAERRLIAFP